MRLSELLDGLDYRRASEVADPECAGLAYDSRRVTPGMVFFALPGEKTDGHDHAADAAARGAVAVVAERDCGLPPGVAQVFAANTRQKSGLVRMRLAPSQISETSSPSRLSAVFLVPVSWQMVGSQSINEMTEVSFTRPAGTWPGQRMMKGTRTPPSNWVCFPPR